MGGLCVRFASSVVLWQPSKGCVHPSSSLRLPPFCTQHNTKKPSDLLERQAPDPHMPSVGAVRSMRNKHFLLIARRQVVVNTTHLPISSLSSLGHDSNGTEREAGEPGGRELVTSVND